MEGALEEIWQRVLASRRRAGEGSPTDQPGVYALFLRDGVTLPGVTAKPPCLLYIGMTGSSLKERNHLTHASSSTSSPRRSLGSLLKRELELQATPRGAGRSPKDFLHFGFTAAGEARLTEWMAAQLDYGFAVVAQGIANVEAQLIAWQTPLLNLTEWQNPQAAFIRQCRSDCRREARENSLGRKAML